MKKLNYLFLSLFFALSIISCDKDDDSPEVTDESIANTELILGTWNLSDIEIQNSSVKYTQEGIPFEINVSADIIGNNTSTTTFKSNPNIPIDNGSAEIEFTYTISYSILNQTSSEDYTETSFTEVDNEQSSWEINNNTITSTDNLGEKYDTEILELTTNSLKVKASFDDYFTLEELDAPDDATGSLGDIILTYSKN